MIEEGKRIDIEHLTHLPDIRRVAFSAPLTWLAKGWSDYRRALLPCFIYGAILATISAALAGGLYVTGAFTWFLVLTGGFLIIAPILAMGAYQAARILETGNQPSLPDMLFVRSAFRRDLIILGVALFVLYGIWIEAAYLTYGLSTNRIHRSVGDFLSFLFTTPSGHNMALWGSLVGGVIAFLAYALVVVTAPMLLNQKSDIFIAAVTSVRCVTNNFPAMLFWACLIVALTALGIATAFLGLILIFPWIGLSSWHAYRSLVVGSGVRSGVKPAPST